MNRNTIVFLLFILLAGLFRFYNFKNLMTFGPEQAMSLLWSAQMSQHPLLGQPYFRYTSSGHQLFTSPVFNYALLPFLKLFSYNPLPITVLFALLNLTTGILLYLLFKKYLGDQAAFLASLLFLFQDLMIFHSRFIWIVHPMFLLSLLSLYLLFKYRLRLPSLPLVLLGILTAVGIGLDYTYIFFGLPLFFLLFFFSQRKLTTCFYFLLGAVIGEFPHLLFDLRHDFYHTRTLIQYGLDTWARPGQAFLNYYHFFAYWPWLAVAGGWLLARSRPLAAIFLVGYLYLNLSSPLVSASYEITLPQQLQAVQAIASDRPQNFNVISLLDYDTRGHTLRYLLQYRFGLTPQPVENYRNISVLYALSRSDYDLSRPANYELTSFYPYTIQVLREIGSRYVVYKLQK